MMELSGMTFNQARVQIAAATYAIPAGMAQPAQVADVVRALSMPLVSGVAGTLDIYI